MSPEPIPPVDARAQAALDELRELIQRHYPSARFRVERGQDSPAALHLVATVDVDDPDAVLDLVLERMMAIQIEQELPIFVIPLRTPERVAALRRVQAGREPVTTSPAAL